MTTTATGGDASRVGDENSGAARNMPRGLLAEFGEGVAGAVLSAPELSAALLLGATLCFHVVPIAVALGHVAGLALARARPSRRAILLLAWTALSIVRCLADGLASRGAGQTPLWPEAVTIASVAVAAAWAAPKREILAAAAACVLGAAAAASWHLGPDEWMSWTAYVTPTNVLPWLVLALGRRGRSRTAMVVAALSSVAAVAWPFLATSFRLPPRYAAAYFAALAWGAAFMTLWMLLPAVAGAAATAAPRGVPADDGTRAVVLLQRRPWASALGVAATLLVLPSFWTGVLFDRFDRISWLVGCAHVASVGALLASIAGPDGRTFARLAPILAVSIVASLVLLFTTFATSMGIAGEQSHPVLGAAAYLAPPFLAWALLAAPLRSVRFAAFGATAALAPFWAASSDVHDVATPALAGALIVLVPVVIVLAARSRLAATRLVACAVLIGFALRLLLELRPRAATQAFGSSGWFELPGAWFLAAVFAVIARRCLSMTAVPSDHPSVTDFGAGRPRVSAASSA